MEHINHSYIVRGAIFEVHKTLGSGLLESVYEAALLHELGLQGFAGDCATGCSCLI